VCVCDNMCVYWAQIRQEEEEEREGKNKNRHSQTLTASIHMRICLQIIEVLVN